MEIEEFSSNFYVKPTNHQTSKTAISTSLDKSMQLFRGWSSGPQCVEKWNITLIVYLQNFREINILSNK